MMGWGYKLASLSIMEGSFENRAEQITIFINTTTHTNILILIHISKYQHRNNGRQAILIFGDRV